MLRVAQGSLRIASNSNWILSALGLGIATSFLADFLMAASTDLATFGFDVQHSEIALVAPWSEPCLISMLPLRTASS